MASVLFRSWEEKGLLKRGYLIRVLEIDKRTMKIRGRITAISLKIWNVINEKFFSQFGFYIKDVNVQKIEDYMHEPKDASSLAVTRILFGLAMVLDVPSERGGAEMETRWGADVCHFPLLPFLQPVAMPYMALVYAGLWFGATGILLGYKYRWCSIMFTACYWYLVLIDKGYWNNHTYLFGLVALLLSCTQANCYWSIDAYEDPAKFCETVPYWNYFILKYQFFVLYFMAGLKKGSAEWLAGYAMRGLGQHWLFWPFRLFLTVPQIDQLIVHWFIFLFDLTIAFWMMYSRSRHVAMMFCALFHLMNTRLFSIGMFPWVCLATMPLFYPFDWPKVITQKIKLQLMKIKNCICTSTINFILIDEACDCTSTSEETNYKVEKDLSKVNDQVLNSTETEDIDGDDDVFNDDVKAERTNIAEEKCDNEGKFDENYGMPDCRKKNRSTIYFIFFYVIAQAFLPFSHFITKGYNNWTPGLYGYSWDMMVHSWDTHSAVIKVVDNKRQAHFYVDPYRHSSSERWSRHGDMLHQYVTCFKEKILQEAISIGQSDKLSQNLSMYVDVWQSLNGRVLQRQFDPKVDMLQAEWSPFKEMYFVMPLLDDSLEWRRKLDTIRDHVLSWNNQSDVVFMADFPGYDQEKFITSDLRNVSLTILGGDVVYEPQVTAHLNGYSYKLTKGDSIPLDLGTFHTVYNVGREPAYYMYTFYNSTTVTPERKLQPKLPIATELLFRFKQFQIFILTMFKNLGNIMLGLCKCK